MGCLQSDLYVSQCVPLPPSLSLSFCCVCVCVPPCPSVSLILSPLTPLLSPSSVFYDADQFNGDLSAWDVSKVTDMEYSESPPPLSLSLLCVLPSL